MGSKVQDDQLSAIDDALNALARFDECKAKVVKPRFFGGGSGGSLKDFAAKRDARLEDGAGLAHDRAGLLSPEAAFHQ